MRNTEALIIIEDPFGIFDASGTKPIIQRKGLYIYETSPPCNSDSRDSRSGKQLLDKSDGTGER